MSSRIRLSEVAFAHPDGPPVFEHVSLTLERGWTAIAGPNGAGKTTLLQLASAQIHPSDGVAGVLEEVLGTVDVFELRPRIGLTSAALAERIPRGEKVRDLVVSASYAVVGRWREAYDELDHERAWALTPAVETAFQVATYERILRAQDPDGRSDLAAVVPWLHERLRAARDAAGAG